MKREIAELRAVVDKLVPMLAGKGLKVTQIGARAFVQTDARTRKPVRVNIPSIPENAEPDFIRAIQGFIDHEIGHVLVTDWDYFVEGDERDPVVKRRRITHNIIEDTMIEREMPKILPGSRRNISDLRRHFINRVTKPELAKVTDPKQRFVFLLVPAMRALAGHVEFQEFMDEEGLWDEELIAKLCSALSEDYLKRLRTCSSSKETLELALELDKILYPPTPPSSEEESDPEDKTGESEDKPDKKPEDDGGDGERDHSESEADPDEKTEGDEDGDGAEGEEGESDESGKPDKGDTDDTGDEGDEGEDEADAESPSGEDDEVDADDAEDGDDDVDAEEGGDGGETDEEDTAESDGEEKDTSAGSEAEEGSEADDGSETDEAGDEEGEGEEPDGSSDEDGEGEEPDGSSDEDGGEKSGGTPDHEGETSDDSTAEFDTSFAEEEFGDDAFEGRDLSEEVSKLIEADVVAALSAEEYTVFTKDFDLVEPLKVPSGAEEFVERMEEQMREFVGPMQKEIERLMAAKSRTFFHPGYRSGRLNGPSLHRLMTQDDRVFRRKQEIRSKNTAVTLLVDMSGSMNGSKINVAATSAYALTQVLERVNVPVETIGFTTRGFHIPRALSEELSADKSGIVWSRTLPLYMPIFKSFEERVSPTVKARFAAVKNQLTDLCGNIDGECLEYAALRLLPRKEERKVMIVLSDGAPVEARNAGGHLKKVVEDLTKANVETVGIGIMTDAVRMFYDNWLVINKPKELPAALMGELRKILLK